MYGWGGRGSRLAVGGGGVSVGGLGGRGVVEDSGRGRRREEERGGREQDKTGERGRTSFVTVSRFGLFMLLVWGSVLWRREDRARVEVRWVRTSWLVRVADWVARI